MLHLCFFLLMDSVSMGPHTSPCTNCNFSVEHISPTGLTGFLYILPSMHPSQNNNLAVFEACIHSLHQLLADSLLEMVLSSFLIPGASRSHPCSDTTDACSEDTTSQSSWYNLSTNEPVPLQHLPLLNLTDFFLDAAALTETKSQACFGTYIT